jgi:catechol 2,3-dioxygenase
MMPDGTPPLTGPPAGHSAAAGAPRRRADGLPADAHVGRARLRVADLDRSLGFYRDLLGMRVVRDEGAVLTLSAGDLPDTPADRTTAGPAAAAPPRELLVLHEMPGIAPRPRRPVTTGLYHVALLVPGRGALGRALLGLERADYPLRGASDHAVSESLYLDDPDGNGLEIYADRPRAAWRWADGQVHMTTEPMDVSGVVAAAGHPGPWRGLPRETVVGHVHLTVSRLERSVAFYRDLVGFDEVARMPAHRPTLAGVSAGGYHHHLNLNVWAGEGAPADSGRVAGLTSWELVIPGAAERRALVDRLTAGGVRVQAAAGQIAAPDPDGITVEISDGA